MLERERFALKQSFCLTLRAPPPRREGNGWSHSYCRRQWSLADAPDLRYRHLLAFEAALHALDERYQFVGSSHQIAFADEEKQVREGAGFRGRS